MRTLQSLVKIIIIPLLLLVISGCSGNASFRSQLVDKQAAAAEIGLADHNGTLFRLSDQKGKVVLVFFGFTNCVDECPLTLAHIKLALESMGDRASDVQVVMVSTDPVRDTPQALQDFMGKFNPNFLGIPGTVGQLEKVWRDYGVMVEHGGETHGSLTYIIDKSGDLRLAFNPDMPPEDIAHDLKIIMDE